MFFGIYGIVNPKEKEKIKLCFENKICFTEKEKNYTESSCFHFDLLCGLSNRICVMK